MEPSYRLRLYLLTALVLVGFGGLLSRLHDFQIVRRDEFLQKVPGNRTVTVREPGTRGEITDRNGVVLAKNVRNYEVSFNLDEIRQAYLTQHDDPTIEKLTKEDGMPRKRKEKDIVAIVTDGPVRILGAPGLDLARPYNAKELRTHYVTHGGLIPYSYRSDLSYEEFAKFAEHNLDLPGVSLSLRPQRQYPYGALASHVLGTIKKWEKGDVPESAMRKYDHYIGDAKGDSGVEATMDKFLQGPEGQKAVVKDEKGRTIRMSDYTKPGSGAKVKLAIDAPVQYLLENTLRYAGRAAGVIMDVNTGEVLAMASIPDLNPNDFYPTISQESIDAYYKSKLAPLTNRAISAYQPGSTMKIPISISAALAGMANKHYSCNGYVTYGNARVQCWIGRPPHNSSHGGQNISEAIQHSCNPYFNHLANTLPREALIEGCSMVNIGKRTGIELPAEKTGILTGSRAWRTDYPNEALTDHAIAMLSIGQGQSMATPLQICSVAACVANGGKYYQPRVVKEVISETGKVLVADTPKLQIDLIQAGIKPADFELIREGMRMSTNERGGTSGKVKLPTLVAASKSGTAQATEFGKFTNISWIMSFAPYDNPKYAICIMVQNAQSGGAVCGPLTNLVYRGLFARDLKGIRLPLKPQTKVPGYIGENIKSIEITPEAIAAVEAGDTSPAPEAVTAVAAEIPLVIEEDIGETGEESGEVPPPIQEEPATDIIPLPTVTPAADAEGSVIPKALPVPEN